MDPSTTLITFTLQTDPSVYSVQLVGSWDNFSSFYVMSRDVRRGRDQWRGCYSFKDSICDSTGRLRRNGGLTMGATYYYYYEMNGSTETYDPAEPCTTACPFLPGQTVNTLTVPIERSLRNRRASLNSLQGESFQTMDPGAKFTTPRPPPDPMSDIAARRLVSAPSLFSHRLPPPLPPSTPSWKRLFSRMLPVCGAVQPWACQEAGQDSAPRCPTARHAHGHASPSLAMLEIEEANDDDWATTTVPDNHLYATSLSPPLFQRSALSDKMVRNPGNSSTLTVTAARPSSKQPESGKGQSPGPARGPVLLKLDTNRQIRWSNSPASSLLISPESPQLVEDEPPSFYDSNDEDEALSCNDGESFPHMSPLHLYSSQKSFTGYSLPRQHDEMKTVADSSAAKGGNHAPHLLARSDSGEHIGGPNLLDTTINTGLDDFVTEMGWIVDVIDSGYS